MPHSLAEVFIHIVFSTKNRVPLIQPEIENSLHAYLSSICRALGSPAVQIGGVEDHVHMMSKLSRTVAICDLLEEIKKRSSKWLKDKDPVLRDFSWQNGYWAASVSKPDVPRVIDYIENQRQHHRRVSFREEYLEILREHGVDCDERYLWD
jgi:REP element-mobilizing transposase RayT